MPHLIVDTPENTKFEFLLEAEIITIGRSPTCSLQLESGQVSRQHAELVRQGPTYLLKDLGSSNGTILNGKPVQEPAALINDSVIAIGDFQLTYKAPRVETQITFALIGQSPPVENHTFVLPTGQLTVGRSDDSSIVVDHHSISRQHALIDVSQKEIRIEDSQSSNGTFINNESIHKKTLASGDVLRFGTVEFKLAQMEQPGVTEKVKSLNRFFNRSDRNIKLAALVAIMSVGLLITTLSIAIDD